MVDIVKTPFDIAFYELFCSVKSVLYPVKCCVTAPARSESVRIVTEYRLINRLQYLPYGILYKLVSK